jgi:TfoX/Sxy family transcriptional regulator of competence genes
MADWGKNDEALIERVSGLLSVAPVRSKSMFGTTAWFLEFNDLMFAGAGGDGMTVRVGVERTAELIESGDADPFDPLDNHKAMKEYVLLNSDRIAEDEDLLNWLDEASEFAGSLPPKKPKRPKRQNDRSK